MLVKKTGNAFKILIVKTVGHSENVCILPLRNMMVTTNKKQKSCVCVQIHTKHIPQSLYFFNLLSGNFHIVFEKNV